MIADGAIDMEQVLNGKVGDGDEDDVEADDDQRADREVGDDGWFVTVKELAAVENTKEECEVDGVEQDDMKQVLVGVESIQMPGK